MILDSAGLGLDNEAKQLIAFEQFKIGNYKVFKTSDMPSYDGAFYVFILNPDETEFVEFSLSPYDKKGMLKNQTEITTILDRILSTFKFTDISVMPSIAPSQEQVFCTQDAMECPDGTWVGRSGPKCEFVCPQ